MKRTPQDEKVIGRMAPGVLSRGGFLGDDRRSLAEILAADRAAVEALGLTHARIADALDAACRAAMSALGAPVHLPGTNRVAEYHEAMGRIASPWPDGRTFAKGEIVLADPASGESVVFTPLSVHLIRAHGFYQGRGSCYRLEPAKLARVLGLERKERKP